MVTASPRPAPRPPLGGAHGYPVALVLGSILSVQFGGALAATLIPLVGVFGSVALRLAIGAVIMLLIARPDPRRHGRGDWLTVVAFGLALAAMNTSFYGAIGRLPMGVAVTIEFLGPLLLSAAMSRHLVDGIAVLSAAAGVVLISEVATAPLGQIDLLGIALALGAGAMWAAYIVLSARTGRRFAGTDGLAWAMVVAALLVVPAALIAPGGALFTTEALVKGAGIAILSSVLPYSMELLALRRLDPRAFGILLSLEPAAAALAGLLVLEQGLAAAQLAGMALVVCASAVVTVRSPAPVD